MKKSLQLHEFRKNSSNKTTASVLVLLTMLFIGLSLAAALKFIHPVDVIITNFILSFKSHFLTQAAVIISWFGEVPQAYFILVLSAVALYFTRYRWEAIVLIVSNIAAIVLEEIIKLIVRSPGPGVPSAAVLEKLSDYSFPSGHVIFYITFFGLICYFIVSKMEQTWKKVLLLTPPGIIIIMIGVSRVYLLQHWISDVVGGYLLGGLFLIISIRVYEYGIVNNFKLWQRK
ncbi:MAG: phosphatase PAP2 family protein [Eubacteriales bacterium]